MMIAQLAALGSTALAHAPAGSEDEIVAAWFVGVLLASTVMVVLAVSAYNLVKRERWRRELTKLISRKLSDVDS